MLPVLKEINDFESIFSSKWKEVVFRNFGKVSNKRLAQVLRTTEEEIQRAAWNLGLEKIKFSDKWLKSGYVSLIYDNWKILPYNQLLELLDWTEEKLESVLKEEDFLVETLGGFKPSVGEVVLNPNENTAFKYREYVLSKDLDKDKFFDFGYNKIFTGAYKVNNETNLDLSRIVSNVFGVYGQKERENPTLRLDNSLVGEDFTIKDNVICAGEEVGFLRGLQGYFGDNLTDGTYSPKIKERIIYGYETGCGDLQYINVDEKFSDQLLSGLLKCKINGIFLHAIFYELCKFPFSDDVDLNYKLRILKLNQIINKCKAYGIKVYLYINEPRCMPIEFFNGKEELLGYKLGQFGSLCTSVQQVKDFLKNAAKEIAERLPELAGFISITMSENLTNCYSKGHKECKRCVDRRMVDVVAEVNNLIAEGLREAGTGAKLLAWTWAWFPVLGWSEDMVKECIKLHDDDITILFTSEDNHTTDDGYVIGDYSVAHPGPSRKTKECAEIVKDSNKKLFAKIQTNNSWECPAVPYFPFYTLQLDHVKNMVNLGVDGAILSWTMGGYPSNLLEMVGKYCFYDISYEDLFKEKFGNCWQSTKIVYEELSQAFKKMPFSAMYFYVGPSSRAPLLKYIAKTRKEQSSMIGYVYDDIDYWFDGVDKERFIKSLCEVIEGLEKNKVSDTDDQRMLEVMVCVLKSAYHYIDFTKKKINGNIDKFILKKEFDNIENLLSIMLEDGRIGYETSKGYLFHTRNLVEKLLQLKMEING